MKTPKFLKDPNSLRQTGSSSMTFDIFMEHVLDLVFDNGFDHRKETRRWQRSWLSLPYNDYFAKRDLSY